jgi:hypothetical protein
LQSSLDLLQTWFLATFGLADAIEPARRHGGLLNSSFAY